MTAFLVVSAAAFIPSGESLSISGTRGGICWKDGAYYLTDAAVPRNEQTLLAAAEGAYESMWKHFSDCIRTGNMPLTGGAEGRRALEIVTAAYSSMQIGRPVAIGGTLG